MAHFTCVGATVPELHETLEEMRAAGIDNVLALRGDPPAGQEAWTATEGGLEYSRELVELISGGYPFAIGAACFPETHIHATSAEEDLEHLAEKVDAGVDFLITNLFFDNDAYFAFLKRAREAGITVPIIPGIMPITRAGQIQRMAKMCGASIPEGLARELDARGEDEEAVRDFGVAYATLQCAELLAAGAPGIHFYTLNRSPATRAILSALRLASSAWWRWAAVDSSQSAYTLAWPSSSTARPPPASARASAWAASSSWLWARSSSARARASASARRSARSSADTSRGAVTWTRSYAATWVSSSPGTCPSSGPPRPGSPGHGASGRARRPARGVPGALAPWACPAG